MVDPLVSPNLGQIINQAAVMAYGGLDDTAQAQTNLRPQGVRLSKAAPYRIWPGQTITYTLRLENLRDTALYQVEVRDPVAQYDLYPAQISHGGSLEGNSEIVWRLPMLAPNETISLTWQATVPPDTPRSQRELRNQADLTTGSGLRDSAQVVSYLAFPDLKLYKGATAAVGPGEVISYTLWVENAGQGTAAGVAVRDPLPAYLIEPLTINDGGQFSPFPSPEIVWSLGTLALGQSRLLT